MLGWNANFLPEIEKLRLGKFVRRVGESRLKLGRSGKHTFERGPIQRSERTTRRIRRGGKVGCHEVTTAGPTGICALLAGAASRPGLFHLAAAGNAELPLHLEFRAAGGALLDGEVLPAMGTELGVAAIR